MPRDPSPPLHGLKVVMGSVFLLAIGATVYCAFTYSGPYRWLADFQIQLFGGHSAPVTFLLLTIGLIAPPTKAVLVAQRAGWLPRPDEGAPAVSERHVSPQASAATRIRALQPWVVLASAGLIFAYIGVRDKREASAGRQLQHATCEQFEANQGPSGTWLEITGRPMAEAKLEAEHNYGHWVYLPLVSQTWSAERPVGVVLKAARDGNIDLGGPAFRGARVPEGLPGMVRARYEEAGLQVERALVLEVNANPADKQTMSSIFTLAGPALFLIGAMGGFVVWRRRRDQGASR